MKVIAMDISILINFEVDTVFTLKNILHQLYG